MWWINCTPEEVAAHDDACVHGLMARQGATREEAERIVAEDRAAREAVASLSKTAHDAIEALDKYHLQCWRPISTAPKDTDIILGGIIVPSETARRNGSKTLWYVGVGRALWDDENGVMFSGFHGSYPTYWMPMPDLPEATARHAYQQKRRPR